LWVFSAGKKSAKYACLIIILIHHNLFF